MRIAIYAGTFDPITCGHLSVRPFTIRTWRTLHHVPTSALLVESDGHTLGYSSDTSFDPELIAFLEPADIIIHETNFGPGHTLYARLAELPAAPSGPDGPHTLSRRL
jgi:ribonuclease BN (tRNA processing enzyme)